MAAGLTNEQQLWVSKFTDRMELIKQALRLLMIKKITLETYNEILAYWETKKDKL